MYDGYRGLKVYQRAYKNSLEIHMKSLSFPKIETYELGSQIRRSTKSIAMNIAEGYGKRGSQAEFRRFVAMAVGSCNEVRVQLEYCRDLGYISASQYETYEKEYDEIGKMLTGLYKSLENIKMINKSDDDK